jgi:PAS domain S-box-containing protein
MTVVGFPDCVSAATRQSQEHTVQFYADDGILIDELTEFIGSSLVRGFSAVVVATKAHTETLTRRLKSQEVDLSTAVKEGRYLAFEAGDLLSRLMVQGDIDAARFAKIVGGILARARAASKGESHEVVAFGEMVALLWADGKADAAVKLEKLWSGLARTCSFSLRCAYPMQGFSRQECVNSFLQICAEHSEVIAQDSRELLKSKSGPQRKVSRPEPETQALHSELEWRRTEARFKLFVDSVQDYAIFMLDPKGNVTTWNTGAERIKGYQASEIIGRHFSAFYPAEDVNSGKPGSLLDIAEREGHAEDEGWRIRKGGTRFWARVTLTAIRDESGKLIGFGKVTRDLTDQKRAELLVRRHQERLQLFVQCVQDYALFLLDPEGYITTWNSGAERIKGYKASEIIGQHFSCFYPPEERAEKPKYELKIAAKTGRFEDEGWRLRKDGSKFWANVIITALRDETGSLIGFGKVTRDLTQRMLAEKSLQESQRKLKDLTRHLLHTQEEERRRIGRELHDSLGQYLSVIKMKLDSMGSGSTDPGEIMQCSSFVEECIREVRTISYLLYPPMLEELGLRFAILWYLDGFSKRSGIKTALDIPEDFQRLSRDAELALFRVLQECLTNVQRHSGSQTAAIKVMVDNQEVVLEVRDQGRGLPSSVLQEGARDWTGSLGVGLRGMSERLHQLGGKLDISSGESGTTVRAAMPL